jgi:hypothetical protein
MRHFWFGGLVILNAILVALTMLAVNFLFMVVGELPQYEGCVYLNGSLVAFLILFPLAAFLLSSLFTHYLLAYFPHEVEKSQRIVFRGTAFGSALYFSIGAYCAGASFLIHASDLCVLMFVYSVLMMMFARLGSIRVASKSFGTDMS